MMKVVHNQEVMVATTEAQLACLQGEHTHPPLSTQVQVRPSPQVWPWFDGGCHPHAQGVHERDPTRQPSSTVHPPPTEDPATATASQCQPVSPQVSRDMLWLAMVARWCVTQLPREAPAQLASARPWLGGSGKGPRRARLNLSAVVCCACGHGHMLQRPPPAQRLLKVKVAAGGTGRQPTHREQAQAIQELTDSRSPRRGGGY